MQVCHGHNWALELRIARREGRKRGRGYRRVVGVGRHDRGIDGEHVSASEVVGIVHENALVFRCLKGWSGRREYLLNVLWLAGRGNVRRPTVCIHLRLREWWWQNLLENCIFRDLIERNVAAQ